MVKTFGEKSVVIKWSVVLDSLEFWGVVSSHRHVLHCPSGAPVETSSWAFGVRQALERNSRTKLKKFEGLKQVNFTLEKNRPRVQTSTDEGQVDLSILPTSDQVSTYIDAVNSMRAFMGLAF